jgi:hypothetical protein
MPNEQGDLIHARPQTPRQHAENLLILYLTGNDGDREFVVDRLTTIISLAVKACELDSDPAATWCGCPADPPRVSEELATDPEPYEGVPADTRSGLYPTFPV